MEKGNEVINRLVVFIKGVEKGLNFTAESMFGEGITKWKEDDFHVFNLSMTLMTDLICKDDTIEELWYYNGWSKSTSGIPNDSELTIIESKDPDYGAMRNINLTFKIHKDNCKEGMSKGMKTMMGLNGPHFY